MSRSDLFALLGAPLANPRWSWGAVRVRDGAVFLLVWQDESRKINGKHYSCVNAATFHGEELSNLGHAERLKHIDRIRAGASSYMIMCLAVDPKANPRAIASYNDREVFVGGGLIEHEGDWWLERISRQPIAAARNHCL